MYEIREIVEVAQKIEKLGQPITWENIGDPVAKGEKVPDWIKQYVQEAVAQDATYGYSPTKGLLKTREYIAGKRNEAGGKQITADDILFFNGLGDAISKLYRSLHAQARVIGPNPAYPTHSSAEAAHARLAHITYSLDPYNGWAPDLQEMEQKIEANPEITGILIVNPDNPTGYVYTQDVLTHIVALAKKYGLFVVSDEIYSNLAYDDTFHKLASVIGDVPGIAMRGISKEFPWPGGRCGWIEFYNRDADEDFNVFCKSLIDAKMLEVCSTTLPQALIPSVMADERYSPYLEERISAYKRKADIAYDIFSQIPELIVHKPAGAFYMTIVFREGVLHEAQTLSIDNAEVRAFVQSLTSVAMPADKRFCYYLLGATGICIVPLQSGFNSTFNGFRVTLLEQDIEQFTHTMREIAEHIRTYIGS